jgi:hypothetical protein
MGRREGLTLREKALEALETSTRMLQVALDLLSQGNQVEATRVRNEARKQRTISTLLMAEANNLEMNPNLRQSQQNHNITNRGTTTAATH